MFSSALRRFNARTLLAFAVLLSLSFVAPAHSAPVPNDDDQEILIKATLMTFNDANLTGNYSVLRDKASKPFRAQLSVEKLADSFKVYREKKINMESIVGADLDSNKATFDKDGVLNLKGRFKDDEKRIRFDLNFIDEGGVWKLIGISVNYKGE